MLLLGKDFTKYTMDRNTQDEIIEQKEKKRPAYRAYDRKERLLPTLFLALALPFTLFFFGPFEAYCKNYQELDFVFADFAALSLLAALLVAGILFAILWFLPGKAFDITYGLLMGVGVMLFLQGNYLNLGLNAVEGDGIGVATFSIGAMIFNLFLWLAALGGILAAVLIVRKRRELMRLIAIVAMVAVIGVQVLNFAVLSLTTEVWTPIQERQAMKAGKSSPEDYFPGILTNTGLTELGGEGNAVIFIVDRFDIRYYENVLRSDPDFFQGLDGFTLYDNQITKYARTFPSVAYMLTGVENDYSTSRHDYLEKAYTSSTFLRDLKDKGYDIGLYTEKYYAYDDASVFQGTVDNASGASGYTISNRFGLWGDMLRLTLFRYLPIFAKSWVGTINSSDFGRYIEYESDQSESEALFNSDMKLVYEWLTENEFTLEDGKKRFTFLHISGCHLPNSYDDDWDLITTDNEKKWDSDLAMRVSFKIINRYLDEMKRLGVYEDATILITGDHAAAMSDTVDPEGSRVTTLLVKKKGDFGTPIEVNSAPVEQSQLRATILASEGITTEHDYGKSVFDIPKNDKRKRYYHFQKTVIGGDDELVIYEVVGDAKDFENWKLVDRINVGNLYK